MSSSGAKPILDRVDSMRFNHPIFVRKAGRVRTEFFERNQGGVF